MYKKSDCCADDGFMTEMVTFLSYFDTLILDIEFFCLSVGCFLCDGTVDFMSAPATTSWKG